jgi:hypothetical protein
MFYAKGGVIRIEAQQGVGISTLYRLAQGGEIRHSGGRFFDQLSSSVLLICV